MATLLPALMPDLPMLFLAMRAPRAAGTLAGASAAGNRFVAVRPPDRERGREPRMR
jgi:hypothetical protein